MKLTAAFLCTAVLFGGAQALICSAFFELHVDTAISDDHIDDYISGIGDAVSYRGVLVLRISY